MEEIHISQKNIKFLDLQLFWGAICWEILLELFGGVPPIPMMFLGFLVGWGR